MSKKKPKVTCPKCGERATTTMTQYGWRNRCCGLWSWGRKELADERTHRARRIAHAVFDTLWCDFGISRGEAYGLLAEAMNMGPADCHMSIMSAEDAERVPAAVRRILPDLRIDLGRFVEKANRRLASDRLPTLRPVVEPERCTA